MASTRGPKHGAGITHKVLLQVIDWNKKETTYYKVKSYALLESLMRMPSTSNRLNVADKQMEAKIKKELEHFWEHGMHQTEDIMKFDLMYVLELGLCQE
jgi:hypothetical protein